MKKPMTAAEYNVYFTAIHAATEISDQPSLCLLEAQLLNFYDGSDKNAQELLALLAERIAENNRSISSSGSPFDRLDE